MSDLSQEHEQDNLPEAQEEQNELIEAIENFEATKACVLIDTGLFDINEVHGDDGWNVLLWASHKGLTEVVKKCI